MEIRRMQSKDARSFHAMWELIYAEGHYFEQKPAPLPRIEEMVAKVEQFDLPNFVAIEGSDLVGEVEAFPGNLFGRHGKDVHKTGHFGIQVHPEYRNRGLGRQLTMLCLKDAVHYGLERIELEVMKSNTHAIRLYERSGFSWSSDGRDVELPSGARTQYQKMVLSL